MSGQTMQISLCIFLKLLSYRNFVQIYGNFRTCLSFQSHLVRPSFFSSPEPLGSQDELIVYPWSGVRRPSVRRRHPQCSNIFSETAWPIKANFMWCLLGKGERKFI